MTIYRSLYSALAVIFLSLAPACTLADEIKKPEAAAHWMVLIQSRSYPGWRKELLEKDGTKEACLTRNFARDSRWGSK